VDPPSSGVLWARKRLPEGAVGWGKFAEPRWHRIALVNDRAVVAVCGRVFVAAMDTSDTVPDGAITCRLCTSKAASQRLPFPDLKNE
jgi:hypothetical protein